MMKLILFRNLGFIYLNTYEQLNSNNYYYEKINFCTPLIFPHFRCKLK
jgi:hypothetical protein